MPAVIIMALLMIATLIVIQMSFSDSRYLELLPETWSLRWCRNFFASEDWPPAARTLLKVAFRTMLVATPVGVLAAYGLYTAHNHWVGPTFTLLLTPMILPAVLAAIGAIHAIVRLSTLYSLPGLALILARPLAVIVVESALNGSDPNLVNAVTGPPRRRHR